MSNPNTITLPDPKDGTKIELEIPEGCPYFRFDNENAVYEFWPDESTSLPLTWFHPLSRVRDKYASWLPIIAAVAACWQYEVAQSRLRLADELWNIGPECPPEKLAACNKAMQDYYQKMRSWDAWRKFTARPEGM